MKRIRCYHVFGEDVNKKVKTKKQVFRELRKNTGRVIVDRECITKNKHSTERLFRRCEEYPLNLIKYK